MGEKQADEADVMLLADERGEAGDEKTRLEGWIEGGDAVKLRSLRFEGVHGKMGSMGVL